MDHICWTTSCDTPKKSICLVHIIVVLVTLLVVAFIMANLMNCQKLGGKREESFTNIEHRARDFDQDVPEVAFPFRNLYDQDGHVLRVILLSAPFRDPAHRRQFIDYRQQGLVICGISSYMEFPLPVRNPYDTSFLTSGAKKERDDYVAMTDAWLHCFRPERVADARLQRVPHMLLTEADLMDPVLLATHTHVKVKTKHTSKTAHDFDFAYVCLKDNDTCSPGWQAHNRNWALALRCLPVLCGHFGLKGLLVGRQNCAELDALGPLIRGKLTVVDFMPYWDFQSHLKRCRFLFVPNIDDASPRVLTEALCHNVRVVVNRHIVGGWHNVVSGVTGEFFTDESDLTTVLSRLLDPEQSKRYRPLAWFLEHRGKEVSGRLLADFLRTHFSAHCPQHVRRVGLTK